MIVAGRKRFSSWIWLPVLMLGLLTALPQSRCDNEGSIKDSVTQLSSSTIRVAPSNEDVLSDDNENTAGKWCLKLITETRGVHPVFESKELNSHISENFLKSERYRFIAKLGNRCGDFGIPKPNETFINILFVSVRYLSKSETLLCVEFVRGFDEYLENITIAGDKLPTKVVKLGETQVISGLTHRCTYKYTVDIKCKNCTTKSKGINIAAHWFPVKLKINSPDVIHWSYPEEGLPCVKEFQIDLNVPSQHRRNKRFKVVPKDQEIGGNFTLQLQDSRDICFPKNVTITPISTDGMEGIPETQYSDLTLNIEPIVMRSLLNNIWIYWKIPELFDKCVKEVRVFNGSGTTAIKPPGDRATFRKLDACRLYTFTIEVIDLDGVSRSKMVTNATNWNVVEGSVVELDLVKNESQPTSIQWNPPRGMEYCIGSYLIEERYHDVESGQESNISSTIRVAAKRSSNQIFTFPLNVSDAYLLISVRVTPISVNGSRWKTATLYLSSRDSVQNLRIHPLSPSSINITWNPLPKFSDSVAYYSIYMQKYPNSPWNSTSSSIMINNLEPCISYHFIVVPVNRYGFKYSSANASISMPELRISRVQQVKSLGDKIQWSLPAQGLSCIKGFQVTQKTANDRLIVNTTIFEKSEQITYSIRKTADAPCATLKLRIIPVSLGGQLGDPHEVIVSPKPGPVHNVSVSTRAERQVTISWMKPELFLECVRSYRIFYDDRNLTTLSYETSVTIQNLNSCMEYNFTIATVDSSGEDTASVVVNATIKEEKVGGVQDLELIELDPRSLMVRWKPPENGTYCVASYRYVAWATGEGHLPEQVSNSTTDVHVTIEEVHACAKYNVQVIPVSKGNIDGNLEMAEIVVKARVILRYHIHPVWIVKRTAQSLELQTALTNDNNNNCELHAIRFTCTTNNVPEGEDPKVITGEAEITDPKADFSAVIAPLQPYNEYNCTAAILNIAGWSDETALVPFMTSEDFPEHPQNLQLMGGYRMVELTWKAPEVKNGIISSYRVHIRSEGVRYPTPSYCPPSDPYNFFFDLPEDDENARLKNWDNDELDHRISFLNPYTDYVVQVAAATKAGLGPYTEMVVVMTLPEQPEPVFEFSDLNVTLPEVNKPFSSMVHILWKIPCHLHGRLRKFAGQFVGYQDTIKHSLGWSIIIDPSEEILEKYSLTEARLEPDFQYNVSIMVFVEDVANHSDAKFLGFQLPSGIPNMAKETNWGTVNAMDSTRMARISLSDSIFKSNIESIKAVALLVSERLCQPDPIPKRNVSNEWPDVLSWKVASQMPCTPQYRTTPRQWNPIDLNKVDSKEIQEIEYIIGKDHCEEVQGYCNGPLKPGTEYALIMRIFTNRGYSDSPVKFFQTDWLLHRTVIVALVIALVLLAFGLVLVILWRIRKKKIPPPRTTPVSPVHLPNEEMFVFPSNRYSGIYEQLRWSTWLVPNAESDTRV